MRRFVISLINMISTVNRKQYLMKLERSFINDKSSKTSNSLNVDLFYDNPIKNRWKRKRWM